jgi:hypothetical protein
VCHLKLYKSFLDSSSNRVTTHTRNFLDVQELSFVVFDDLCFLKKFLTLFILEGRNILNSILFFLMIFSASDVPIRRGVQVLFGH